MYDLITMYENFISSCLSIQDKLIFIYWDLPDCGPRLWDLEEVMSYEMAVCPQKQSLKYLRSGIN